MSIEWQEEYNLGFKEIDEQHKKLVKLIDRLNDAICQSKIKEEVGIILRELIEYNQHHFSTEEKYFDKFEYENSAEHKEEHRKFEKDILNFNDNFKNNESEVSFKLIDFLEDWLIGHLEGEDKKYVECFKENGLS